MFNFNRFSRRNFLRNPIDSSEFSSLDKDISKKLKFQHDYFTHYIISPYKKSADKLTNIKNIKLFEKILINKGFVYYKQIGFYMGDVEPSYIVECPLFNAIKYGNMFNQDSIIGIKYNNETPSVSDIAVYIDLKNRNWQKMELEKQIYPMNVKDFFYKELEGSYVIDRNFYYIYKFDDKTHILKIRRNV
jgi:hypothetical protein